MVTLTIAAGWTVRALGGSVGGHGAPFYVEWAPVLSWYLAPALVLLGLGIVLARHLCTGSVRPLAFAAVALGATLAMRLALNAARGGPAQWYGIFDAAWDAQYEYLPSLAALRLGTGSFLDRFAELSPALSIHPSGHPPGTLLLLHFLDIGTARPLAALTIGVGALCAPLVYVLGRELLDDARARVATVFYAFSPSSLLYGATSVDALYATLGLAAATALVSRRRLVAAVGGPVLLVVASFFSYALIAIGAWAALVVARGRGLTAAVKLAVASALVVVVAYLVLYALTGFDVLGSLAAVHGAYTRGISRERPYWYWLLGSPTAFLVALGLPLAWLVLRGAGRGERSAMALMAVVAVAAIIGFTKAENERIWLFLVPLACVAAAAQQRRSTTLVLAALAAQAIVVQVLLETRW